MTPFSSTAAEIRELRRGIFNRQINDQWVRETPSVIETLKEHFNFDPLTTILPPSPEPDRLRYELMMAAPTVCQIGCSLMNLLSRKAVVVIVSQMHLGACTVEERKLMLYALSVIMGYPTGTDPRENAVVWPVTARAKNGQYFATYSELDSEAEYHTDAQYYADPERYFLLYVNRAARCGGGLSRVRSNAEIMRHLQDSPEGRAAIAVLRNRLYPFRIPSVYTRSGSAEDIAYTFAPVLTGTETIRWRRDTIEKGLGELDDFDGPEVRKATQQLLRAFKDAPEELVMNLPDDSLILVDNHRAVHARAAFKDQERFLFRVRFHNQKHVR